MDSVIFPEKNEKNENHRIPRERSIEKFDTGTLHTKLSLSPACPSGRAPLIDVTNIFLLSFLPNSRRTKDSSYLAPVVLPPVPWCGTP